LYSWRKIVKLRTVGKLYYNSKSGEQQESWKTTVKLEKSSKAGEQQKSGRKIVKRKNNSKVAYPQ
jgi:hypothetical protein